MQNCFFVTYLKPASVAVCLCKAHFHPQPFFLVQQIFLCKEDPRPWRASSSLPPSACCPVNWLSVCLPLSKLLSQHPEPSLIYSRWLAEGAGKNGVDTLIPPSVTRGHHWALQTNLLDKVHWSKAGSKAELPISSNLLPLVSRQGTLSGYPLLAWMWLQHKWLLAEKWRRDGGSWASYEQVRRVLEQLQTVTRFCLLRFSISSCFNLRLYSQSAFPLRLLAQNSSLLLSDLFMHTLVSGA